MTTREGVIRELSSRHDPRLLKWEYKVILDTLQEQDEPVQVSELLEAINEKYETDNPLLDYNSLHYNVKALIEQGAVQNNNLSKKISINPDYITHKVQYLPVSNYCMWLLAISGAAFVFSLLEGGYGIKYTGMAIIIGTLYIIGQIRGSKFKIGKQK